MPVSDLDIARSAHLYVQIHGDDAVAKARLVPSFPIALPALHAPAGNVRRHHHARNRARRARAGLG